MTGNRSFAWLGLEGRVCVITGAAGAIGAEIARRFVDAGALVAVLDLNEAGAVAIAGELDPDGKRAIGVACDVSSSDSVAAAAVVVEERFGGCDILVNNAAALHSAALIDIAPAEWNRVLSINLTGYLLPAQAFARQMIARGSGAIVHVSSVSGSFPQPFSGAYSVSKAGVGMLSQVLAVELGDYAIRSNVVSPGMVHTPMSDPIYKDPATRRCREEIVPARRISTPDDLADSVVFLASDRSAYIKGQNIAVDGGLSQVLLSLIPRPGFDKAAAERGNGQGDG